MRIYWVYGGRDVTRTIIATGETFEHPLPQRQRWPEYPLRRPLRPDPRRRPPPTRSPPHVQHRHHDARYHGEHDHYGQPGYRRRPVQL